MLLTDAIKQYSATVCDQIRWKKAHAVVATEIENHIYDQRDAYLQSGEAEEAATEKAILQMGDAVMVGLELDKTHKPKAQWAMILLTASLMLVGLFANDFAARYEYAIRMTPVLMYLVAFAVFLICYFMDFTILAKHPLLWCGVVLVVVQVSLLCSIQINGALYIVVGPLYAAVRNMAIVFPLLYALVIYAMRTRGYVGILLCGAAYLPLAFFLVQSGTVFGLMLFTASALVILCVAINRGWFGVSRAKGLVLVLIPTALVCLGLVTWLAQNGYYEKRLERLFHPYADPMGAGYLNCLIRDMLAGAVPIGRGTVPERFGGTIPSVGCLDTDYILSLLIHHFGWISFLLIMGLMALFAVLCFRRIFRQKSALGLLVSLSVLCTFVIQTFFYVIQNMGLFLIGAMSIPFISYGNSALLLNAALVGFMLSVFRTGDVFRDAYVDSMQKRIAVSFKKGKLVIDFCINQNRT